jgi:hypothetical protein
MPIHESKHCKRCDTTKGADEFYRRRKGEDLSPYCKPCTNSQTLERQRAFKLKCIEYKGGECVKCGYNKCAAALDFHHMDPTQKDISISKLRLTTFNDKVKEELDKCILVCSNCHREIHWEQKNT